MTTREQEIRTWSMLCHLSALAILFIPFGNLLGPLIVWQIKRKDLPEIDPHAKESINFQITLVIITIIFSIFLAGSIGYGILIQSPLTMITSGVGLALFLAFIHLVGLLLVIIAGIKANNGELYNYPGFKFLK
jgi:uncharacterized protein